MERCIVAPEDDAQRINGCREYFPVPVALPPLQIAAAVAMEEEEVEEEEEEQEEEEEEEEEEELEGEEQLLKGQGSALDKGGEAAAGPCAPPGSLGFPQQPAQRGAKRSRASTAKERISKMPPCAAGKRSSIYRGVTRHRWTGRYEAHLWDKSTWNQNQNKKGKQVYLGAYDDEEAAARAYDLAALKYWGPGTLINFPVTDYARDIDEMQSVSREDYLASLRRKSSGFSRGVSKMRGVSRHHPNIRWDVQTGRSFASGLPQLSAYGTLGDGGAGRSVLDYGGLGCSTTMINLCHFMNWLQPPNIVGETPSNPLIKSSIAMEEEHSTEHQNQQRSPGGGEENSGGANEQEEKHGAKPWQCYEPYQLPSLGLCRGEKKAGLSALSALSQSPMFTKLEERLNASSGRELAARGCSESAGAALAAAIAMADCPPPPCSSSSSGAGEKTACRLDHENGYGDVHPRLALPLPPLPFAMDHSAYLSDQTPCLWNPFEPPLSMSMPLQ